MYSLWSWLADRLVHGNGVNFVRIAERLTCSDSALTAASNSIQLFFGLTSTSGYEVKTATLNVAAEAIAATDAGVFNAGIAPKGM